MDPNRKRGTSFGSFRERLKRRRLSFEGEGSTGNAGSSNNWEVELSFNNNTNPVHLNSASTDVPRQENNIRNTTGSPHDEDVVPNSTDSVPVDFPHNEVTENMGPVRIDHTDVSHNEGTDNMSPGRMDHSDSSHNEESDAIFSDVSRSPLLSPESKYGKPEYMTRTMKQEHFSEDYSARNRGLRRFRVTGVRVVLGVLFSWHQGLSGCRICN